jgi:hypothetical protein
VVYPGRVIVPGEKDHAIVECVQRRLVELSCGPTDAWGVFGPRTRASVKLFQVRHVDGRGIPLSQDGKVGPLTWQALFGPDAVVTRSQAATPFLEAVLDVAGREEPVREQPPYSNSGPRVDEYLRRAGVPLRLPAAQKPWCCAFVYWCFDEAASAQGRANPMVRTAGCLEHWRAALSAGVRCIRAAQSRRDPSLIRPGMVFIIDHGGGKGHTGFVTSVNGGLLHTIEGNTDGSATRDGGGVYRLVRQAAAINRGFVDYSNV